MSLYSEFSVTGHFYETKIADQPERLRSLLEIRRKSSARRVADLLVIMMNPGGSRPLDETQPIPRWSRKAAKALVPTRPDRTQYQIMAVMDACGYEYASVVNLSDLREPKSPRFIEKLSRYGTLGPHSLFSKERSEEFTALLESSRAPVLLGWGLSNDLRPLSEAALSLIGKRRTVGKRGAEAWQYYHPLPPNAHSQRAWREEVIAQLRRLK